MRTKLNLIALLYVYVWNQIGFFATQYEKHTHIHTVTVMGHRRVCGPFFFLVSLQKWSHWFNEIFAQHIKTRVMIQRILAHHFSIGLNLQLNSIQLNLKRSFSEEYCFSSFGTKKTQHNYVIWFGFSLNGCKTQRGRHLQLKTFM